MSNEFLMSFHYFYCIIILLLKDIAQPYSYKTSKYNKIQEMSECVSTVFTVNSALILIM